MTTYTCVICHCVNHVARLHCQACGTVPERYSVGERQTVVALNADRTEGHRTVKVNLRTVAADYYASGE
jgi:hypothetical protein